MTLDNDSVPRPDTDNGQVVAMVFDGVPPFERGSAAEPSLLPHLARLCHDFSILEVLEGADEFGRRHPLAWPQLAESVRTTLAARFSDDDFELQAPGWIDPVELAVRRCLAGTETPSPELWERVDALDGTGLRHELACRLAVIDPNPARVDGLLNEVDPDDLDVDATRAYLDLSVIAGRPVAQLGITSRLHDIADRAPGFAAHLIPSVPEPLAQEVARTVLRRLAAGRLPAWSLALFASRLSRFDDTAAPWPTELVEPPHPVWTAWVRRLLDAPPASDRTEDTHRAHPFAATLDRIEGPHERTEGAGRRIVDEHGAGGFETSAPPPETSAPPPDDMDADDGAETGDDDSGDRGLPDDAWGEPPPPPSPPPPSPAPPSPAPVPPSATPPPAAREPAHSSPPTARPSGPDTLPPGSVGIDPKPPVDDRRLGVDLFTDGRLVSTALVAGAATDVVVSIGHGATAAVAAPIGLVFPQGVDQRTLPVRFVTTDLDQTLPMRVRRDPNSSASVTFQIVPSEPDLSALVIVYNEDNSAVVQAAALSVAVVDTAEAAASAAPSVSLARVEAAALSAGSRADSGSVVTDGRVAAVSTPQINLPATTASAIGLLDDVVEAIERAAGKFFAAGSPIDETLLGIARAGVGVLHDMGLEPLAAVDRIQVVSVTGQSVFPLELVYGGAPPRSNAVLCPGWRDGLLNGSCASCGGTDPGVVCPISFWGMSKVIEHHRGEVTGGSDFSARVQLGDGVVAMAAPSSAVVAVSARVEGPEGLPAGLLAAAAAIGHVEVVADWDAWSAAVASLGPSALIAVPHQERISDHGVSRPALELGGRFETLFLEGHVRRPGEQPGPLVLLIGCETGVEHKVLASFASQFRRWSPVVLATVGEVLAEEADVIVKTVLEAVTAAAQRGDGTTMGQAVREARRKLLAESRLSGLQLVLHGDAAWTLTAPTPVGATPTGTGTGS